MQITSFWSCRNLEWVGSPSSLAALLKTKLQLSSMLNHHHHHHHHHLVMSTASMGIGSVGNQCQAHTDSATGTSCARNPGASSKQTIGAGTEDPSSRLGEKGT
jgi:hypothetical protein